MDPPSFLRDGVKNAPTPCSACWTVIREKWRRDQGQHPLSAISMQINLNESGNRTTMWWMRMDTIDGGKRA
jgi:hypothetical protein